MSLRHQHDFTFKSRSFEGFCELRLSKLRADLGQNIRCRFNIVLSSDEENVLEVAEVLIFRHQVELMLIMKECWLRLLLSPSDLILIVRKNFTERTALMDALLHFGSNLLLGVTPIQCCLEPSRLRELTLEKRLG